ncbi:DUF2953 domain-containing protein [Clostridium taeniosporum]|uniref:DUF2953 domain-containing protein n=1 Tax=Clostridium taeniosporum TaxID=394958 RepID=A0A1D7XKL2_9CLOT|nr:DUF2953 domain-containing protein [Clostridium taeniosporum]AOR23872.1 DUF2953 domain-containing protein [Clostridium taeniosporum]
MKLFFIILIILIFIPIPLKISIYYSSDNYYVKLYKFTIISKEKLKTKKHNLNSKSKSTKTKKKNLNISSMIHKKYLIKQLYNSKYKPKINIKGTLDYSLNDAAHTAISYGILSQISPIFYFALGVLFKINKFKFNIKPLFKNKFLVKFEISSIIFISIVKIIYVLIIIFKSILYSEEVNPCIGKNYDK